MEEPERGQIKERKKVSVSHSMLDNNLKRKEKEGSLTPWEEQGRRAGTRPNQREEKGQCLIGRRKKVSVS